MDEHYIKSGELRRKYKTCRKCYQVKELLEFHKDKSAFDLLQSTCKTCKSKMNKTKKETK